MATFTQKLQDHLKATKNIFTTRHALIQLAYKPAKKDNNFDNITMLLNGLWGAKAYKACHSIKEYLEAHCPISIKFTKGEKAPFTSKLCAKATDGTRPEFQTLAVRYNVWEREQVIQDLTADKLIKVIENAIARSEKLEDSGEVAKFEKFLAGVASNDEGEPVITKAA